MARQRGGRRSGGSGGTVAELVINYVGATAAARGIGAVGGAVRPEAPLKCRVPGYNNSDLDGRTKSE